MTNPIRLNGLTERLLTGNGYLTDCVESHNAWSNRTKDFLGFADYIAIHQKGEIVAVQVTTGHNKSARRKKILASIEAYHWLLSGGRIWLLTWKMGKSIWTPSKEDILLEHFPEEFRKKFTGYWELTRICALRDIKDHKLKTGWIDL